MQFNDIKGYEDIKERLVSIKRNNRVSQGYLFFGSEGTPKLALALAFSQYLNCENAEGEDSCGVCSQCKKYSKLVHPDLHFIYPVIRTAKISKPISADFIDKWREYVLERPYHSYLDWIDYLSTGNLQGMIYTEESKEIIRIVNLQRYEGRYKVLIIFMPERMHISAANKLLKVLEEPPIDTIFMLISEDIEGVLPTIRSRVQPIKINRPSTEVLTDTLSERFSMLGRQEVADAVVASENNYSVAYKILSDSEESENKLRIFFDTYTKMMRLAYSNKIIEIIDFVENFCSKMNREEQKQFLQYLLKQIRENFVLNVVGEDKVVYLTKKEREFGKNFNRFITERNVFSFENEISRAYSELERNGNDKLIFLDLMFKISVLLHKG